MKEALVQARQERHDALAPSKRRDPSRLSCIHQTPERDATCMSSPKLLVCTLST